jgi:hypothetical protein
VPVLSLLRPTVSAAGLILPADLMLATGLILATLSVVWVHRVIEVANDVVEALGGSRMCNWNCGHQCDGSSGAKEFGTYRISRHLLVLLELAGSGLELAGSEDRSPFNKRCSISYMGKRDESGHGRKLLIRVYFNFIRFLHPGFTMSSTFFIDYHGRATMTLSQLA